MSFDHINRLRPVVRWTVERIEQLKTLVASGLSYSQVAAELGGGTTRNSAIGKAKRLGLCETRPIRPPKPKVQREHIRLSTTHDRKPPTFKSSPTFKSPPIAFVPTCQPVTFEQLESHHCRFPVEGDRAPFMFCGADKTAGASWCAYHARICSAGYVAMSRAEVEIRRRLQAKERKARAA